MAELLKKSLTTKLDGIQCNELSHGIGAGLNLKRGWKKLIKAWIRHLQKEAIENHVKKEHHHHHVN